MLIRRVTRALGEMRDGGWKDAMGMLILDELNLQFFSYLTPNEIIFECLVREAGLTTFRIPLKSLSVHASQPCPNHGTSHSQSDCADNRPLYRSSCDRLAVSRTQNGVYLDDSKALNQPQHPKKCYDQTESRQSSHFRVSPVDSSSPHQRGRWALHAQE